MRFDKEDVRGIWKGAGIALAAILLIHYFPLRTPESNRLYNELQYDAFQRGAATLRGIVFYVVVIGGLVYLAFGD